MSGMLRIVGCDTMLKYVFDTSLEPTSCRYSTTAHRVSPNKGVASEDYDATFNPAMLVGDLARITQWLLLDLVVKKTRPF